MSLFGLIVVFAAHCCGGRADDNAVAFAANAPTPTIAVAAAATTIAATAATTTAAPAAATGSSTADLAYS